MCVCLYDHDDHCLCGGGGVVFLLSLLLLLYLY